MLTQTAQIIPHWFSLSLIQLVPSNSFVSVSYFSCPHFLASKLGILLPLLDKTTSQMTYVSARVVFGAILLSPGCVHVSPGFLETCTHWDTNSLLLSQSGARLGSEAERGAAGNQGKRLDLWGASLTPRWMHTAIRKSYRSRRHTGGEWSNLGNTKRYLGLQTTESHSM